MIVRLDSLYPTTVSPLETRAEELLRQVVAGYRTNPRPLIGLGCTIAAHVINEAMAINPDLKEIEDVLTSPLKATEGHIAKTCNPEVLDHVFDLSRRALSKLDIEKICLAPLKAARYLDPTWIARRPNHEHDALRKDGVCAVTELVFPLAAKSLCGMRGVGSWETDQAAVLEIAEKHIPTILELHSKAQPAAQQ